MYGPTYISNPALWEQFRHTREGENFIPSVGRKNQSGGGILNQRKAYMIPVKPQHSKAEIKQITPVAAEQERALSDLKEAIRNEEPHMPLKKKKIKRKKSISKASRSTTGKRRGRVQRGKKKTKRHSVKRLKTRKSKSKSVKRKNSRRKLIF